MLDYQYKPIVNYAYVISIFRYLSQNKKNYNNTKNRVYTSRVLLNYLFNFKSIIKKLC